MFNKSKFYEEIANKVSSSNSLIKFSPSKEPPKYVAVIGSQLGDEGKGRIIDNKVIELGEKFGEFYVIRSQGGSNAGHSVQMGDLKIGLHQIPSVIFHENAKSVLDFGMIIHPEDLLTEIHLVEDATTSLNGRMFLSSEAMLCTDVERAKEVLNRVINGNAKGGTGRGISPTTSQRYEKLGLEIRDLMADNWKETLTKHYDRFEKFFEVHGENIFNYEVPDFAKTKKTGKAQVRKVGDIDQYLKRLEEARNELLERKMVIDSFLLNQKLYLDKTPVFFEMAQAIGLSPSFGTRPDVTSTETSALGITLNTRVFKYENIDTRIGVFKATYMSSVGARTMPTEINDEWAKWVRDFAHEYGTTTGRPRDICNLDIPFMRYNTTIGSVNQLGLTHLDVAREDMKLKVCIGYKKGGKEVLYKPDLFYLEEVEPIYLEFDGWDSEEVTKAETFDELPDNTKKYIHFIESALDIPVTVITTGPERDDLIVRY